MSTTSESTRDAGLTAQASARAQEAASTAQEKAAELKERGASRIAEQLDERTTSVGSQARSFAEAMRRSGGQLRGEGKSTAAGAAEQAADRIERMGSYLERKNGDELLRDVEEFARQRPWVVAGGAVLLGMAASRFLKASSERRYETGRRTGTIAPSRSSDDFSRRGADEPSTREPETVGHGSTGRDGTAG